MFQYYVGTLRVNVPTLLSTQNVKQYIACEKKTSVVKKYVGAVEQKTRPKLAEKSTELYL